MKQSPKSKKTVKPRSRREGPPLSGEVRDIRDAKNDKTKARNLARKKYRKDHPQHAGKQLKRLSSFESIIT